MSRPTQKQSLSQSFQQGLAMMSGKNVDNYTLVFLDPTKDSDRNSEQTFWNTIVSLGRANDCVVRYSESFPTVSRLHAYIKIANGKFYIEPDVNATNPTLLNNQVIKGVRELNAGDEIKLSFEGPRIRFINTPTDKTTASMRFTQRFKEFGKQALRPYKAAIIGLASLLLLLVGGLAWQSFNLKKQIGEIKIPESINDTIVIESKSEGINTSHGSGSIANADNANNSTIETINQTSTALSTDLKNLRKDIYFIIIESVQVYHPEENNSLGPFDLSKDLSYRWSGTGFLLDDGSFLTARHVIQPWRFGIECGDENKSDDQEAQVAAFLNNAEISGGKVEVVYLAISPNGDKFTFTNREVQLDQSRDRLICDEKENKNYRVKKCNSLSTDWAKISMKNRKGSLKINRDVSRYLTAGTPLVGYGYSYGLVMQSSDLRFDPILIKAEVVQDKLVNGMINISGNSLAPGSSGGPLMVKNATGEFEVIGIISHGATKVQQLVPVWEIR